MKSFKAYMDLLLNHRFDNGLARYVLCNEKKGQTEAKKCSIYVMLV